MPYMFMNVISVYVYLYIYIYVYYTCTLRDIQVYTLCFYTYIHIHTYIHIFFCWHVAVFDLGPGEKASDLSKELEQVLTELLAMGMQTWLDDT